MTTMQQFKPTAFPLITADPYFSFWSFGDHLYDDSPRSWWGIRAAMTGLLRVDGTWYRFMGKVQPDNRHYFQEPMVLPQTSVQVGATKTGYCFENELVKMELDFRTPLLCEELSLMSRPVCYISYKVDFKDEKEHEVLFYFDMGAEICIRFDKELREDASRISEKYADILSLAYRQVVSSHKLVQKDGKLLYFSKECGSNGCLGTVDVTYPSIPMFLYYKPKPVEGMLNPIFEYAEKEHG